MPRYLRLTEKKIQEMIAEGRGSGTGANYKPWLTISDVPSKGRSHRIFGHKTGRVHHFLSDLEANYYFILAWSDAVIDIREQFPLLPREQTERIAEMLGYQHPRASGNRTNEVMTTDFLITVRDENGVHDEARYVKYEKDLANARVCEKLQIEKEYWKEKGVLFKVVSEKSIHLTKANNIERILNYYDPSSLGGLMDLDVFALKHELLGLLQDCRYMRLANVTATFERYCDLNPGDGMNLFFHMAAHKSIPLRLEQKIIGTQPLSEIIDWDKSIPAFEEDSKLKYGSYD